MNGSGGDGIRAVFFDLGNVLVMYDAQIAVRKFAALFNLSADEIWSRLFTSDLERRYTRGEISSKEFYQAVCASLGAKPNWEVFADAWNHIFWPNPDAEALVRSVSGRYPVFLISNTNELHFEFIKKNYPVIACFQRCFPSHEVGARKPEAKIYEAALRGAKVRAEEAVFIDDVPEFVDGARAVGMKGVVFSSAEMLAKELVKLGVCV